jgi:hypothetical protein
MWNNVGVMNSILLCVLELHGGNRFKLLIFRWWDCIGLIYLAQDRDQWHMLVNTVINFQVP